MNNQDNKNFVENVVDAQKKASDSLVENAKKFTNGNTIVNETVQKGSEWYKNWLETQKNIYTQTSDKTASMTDNLQNSTNQMNDFYKNWFNTQMNNAKQMWEMTMNQFQNANTNNANNPMAAFTNMNNNWNNWMTGMNNTNSWMNAMQQWNNMFNLDSIKNASQNFTGMFNEFGETVKSNFSKMQEAMQSGTTQDAFKNMVNATDGFKGFYEMWMPMWKSIQEKTFTMDTYKQWVNPAMYKDVMDKYLGMMPESTRQSMQQATEMMQNNMKQFGQSGMQGYEQMRGMMSNMMPVNSSEIFGNMLSGYNNMQNMMTEATAPFTKMMTPNANTKSIAEWQDIANRIAIYNIRNAELQYMMYTQGTKVMDKLAENTMEKIEKGQEINSIMALYQEWMNISDTTFVSLFESDEYSVLMAEVSSMKLKLRKDIEGQMEKMMVGIPVATRSEMDEMYKTIYDLKKQVRQMEKMMEIGNEAEEVIATPAPAKKATAAKK